jgi:hypothetical protein
MTSRKALHSSTDVWEVNLMCAQVLQRHSHFDEAEDAILRNLDVSLEVDQSRLCLLSLYYHSANVEKLSAMLQDAEVIRSAPADVLLRCAAMLPPEKLSPKLVGALCGSVYAYFDGSYAGREFVLRAGRNWNLDTATVSVLHGDQRYSRSRRAEGGGIYEVRLQRVADAVETTAHRTDADHVVIILQYPDGAEIKLAMQQVSGAAPELATSGIDPAGILLSVLKLRRNVLQLTAATIDDRTVILRSQGAGAGFVPPAPAGETIELDSPAPELVEPMPIPSGSGTAAPVEHSTPSPERTLVVPPLPAELTPSPAGVPIAE